MGLEKQVASRTAKALAVLLLGNVCIGSVAERKQCGWMMDVRGDEFERLMLAYGYAKVRMYDESFGVLAALEDEDLTRDARADVHDSLGYNHYATKALTKARSHLLQAIASRRLPACYVPERWEALAAVAFEMGHHEEAADYAQRWQVTNDAIHEGFFHMRTLAGKDLLLIAKYWSHVDRARALEYVAAASEGDSDFDAATRVWIAQLREGEAPAEIAPRKRPWLANRPVSLSAAEVLRRIEFRQTYRRRVTRPAPQPGMPPRTGWVEEEWKQVTLAPVQPQAPVPLAHGGIEAPVLRFEYVEAPDASDSAGSPQR